MSNLRPWSHILTPRSNEASCLYFAMFYVVCVNIPFWVASHWCGLLFYGYFCTDYIVVGLLACVMPRLFTAALLFVALAADITCAASKTYLVPPWDCWTNLSSLGALSGILILNMSVVILLAVVLAVAATRLPAASLSRHDRFRVALFFVAFIAVCGSTDYIRVARAVGYLPSPTRGLAQLDAARVAHARVTPLSRRSVVHLVRLQLGDNEATVGRGLIQPNLQSVSSAAALASSFVAVPRTDPTEETPNFILIVVESWGFAADPSVRKALVEAYDQSALLARYKVLEGTVPFYGPTVEGEGRELCGSRIGFHLLSATESELHSCLPNRLAALGYRTSALHGNNEHMFKRIDWYKRIGFQETWFKDRFERQGLPDCIGAMLGTCDAAIAGWIGDRLGQNGSRPEFLYWLTLNSLFTTPIPSPLANAKSCSVTPSLSGKPALCSWYQLVANVNDAVAQLAMKNSSRPSIFVIVGDHAPPFDNAALRYEMSSSVVPYVVLLPQQLVLNR